MITSESFAGSNVVIVGKNSYIGSCFANYARRCGANVVAFSSDECNFLDAEEVLRVFGEDLPYDSYAVVFLAVVNKSRSNTYAAFLDNLEMIKNLIAVRQLAGCSRLIYFSSADVYGRRPRLPITEDTTLEPDTWYGLAKYTCEWMLRNSPGAKCPTSILRIPGIYGQGRNDRSVIGRMIANVRKTGQLEISGSGKVRRDYVFMEDLCRFVHAMIPLEHEGVVNIATGQSFSILDIANAVQKALGFSGVINHGPPEGEREFDLCFDPTQLHALVPDFSFCDLKMGLQSYLNSSNESTALSSSCNS
jgi:UDP-glucose 4-epimerase